MKKFLFTLAALLMAGSAFATNDYCFIPDFKVTEDQLGTEIDVPLMGHFDGYLNALDVDVNYPEGITGVWAEDGADCTVSYFNGRGQEKTTAATWAWNESYTNGIAITGATVKSYWEVDGSWVYTGAPKWIPGDYEELAVLTIAIAEDFDISQPVHFTVVTRPSCGEDVREPRSTGEEATYEVTINPQEQPQPEALTATITIGDADGLFVPVTVTNVNDPEATIVVTANDVEYPIVDGGITLPDYETEYNVVVTVTAKGDNYTGTVSDNKVVTTGAAPVVTIDFDALAEVTVDENGLFTFVYEANDPDAVVTTTVGNEAVVLNFVNGVATYQVTKTDVPGTYNVTATIKVEPNPDGNYVGEAVSDDATYTYTVDEPVIPTAATPVITFTPNEAGVAVNIENYTEYTIKVDGDVVDQVRALPYQVDKTHAAQHIEVYAKNAPQGYTAAEDTETYDLAALPNTPSAEATLGETHRDANNVYVPVNGNVTKVTVDGDEVALVNGEIVLPRQDADYTPVIVIVTNDGQYYDDTEVTFNDIVVPAKLVAPEILVDTQKLTQWIDPDNDGVFEQVQGEVVTFTISTPYDGQVFYTIDGSEAIQYTGEAVPVEGNGTHTVTAYVVVNGEVTPVATKVITVNNDYTGVNEIANGKAVAGVRYFNMAGQEMTEANGVTIVVTTYTDGTTSAVKVMK